MKKLILLAVAILGFATISSAQSKSIGLRFGGYGAEVSYEHYLGDPNFMQFELGTYVNHSTAGFRATALYNWMIVRPDWTPRGEWGLYAGPGVSLGMIPYEVDAEYKNKAFFGVVGQVGLEYRFWFPLELSLDVRPAFAVVSGDFYGNYLAEGLFPTLSVRYCF